MSDMYDYPDADAIPPVKSNAPHALTREQCCGGCKWWSEKRHIVSRERLCTWPIVLPDGLDVSHIERKYMTPEMGTDCPCFERKEA